MIHIALTILRLPMMQKKTEIPVILRFQSGETTLGTIHYTENGLVVFSNGNQIVDLAKSTFGIQENHRKKKSEQMHIFSLQPEDRVLLHPILRKLVGYSDEPKPGYEKYPPATDAWIDHISEGDSAVLFAHKILARNRYFLAITSREGAILNTFIVHPYELGPLFLTEDWVAYRDYIRVSSEEESLSLDNLLNQPPPSWPQLSGIVGDVMISGLQLGKNMMETVQQLVPQSFPQEVRKEVMAFLAWLSNASIPREDPVEFTTRNISAPVFNTLVNGHIRCMLDSVKPPQYVRIMAMANQGLLRLPKQTLTETQSHSAWYVSWITFRDRSPDWTSRVIDFSNTLNENNEPVTVLPVSKSAALRSRKAWSDRFALTTHGLHMRAQIYPEAIGLKTLVNRGAAYTWEHKHLAWSARLGLQKDRSDFIQIMVVPPRAIEQVQRFMKNAYPVEWESSGANFRLYNKDSRKWNVNIHRIISSLKGSRTITRLESEFGPRCRKVISISRKQVKIMDMLSWGVYLASLEADWYSNYYDVTNQELIDTASNLQKRGVLVLRYQPALTRMLSFCIQAIGPDNQICSLARSLRLHTPSATVMIAKNASTCYGFIRVPEEIAYDFVTQLTRAGESTEMKIKCWPISLYSGYLNNLYQRLLLDDGSWDDDVSVLLSQKRDN
jgi:hypothetical protein